MDVMTPFATIAAGDTFDLVHDAGEGRRFPVGCVKVGDDAYRSLRTGEVVRILGRDGAMVRLAPGDERIAAFTSAIDEFPFMLPPDRPGQRRLTAADLRGPSQGAAAHR